MAGFRHWRLRWHPDRRGFTVNAPHPQSEVFSLTVLSVRWAKRGRGVHPNPWALRTALTKETP